MVMDSDKNIRLNNPNFAAKITETAQNILQLQEENKELRKYLKAFVYATIDPEEAKRDIEIHVANPHMTWQFTLVDEDFDCPERVITGGQIRRAMELVGFRTLGIEGADRTIAQELLEARELRRAAEIAANGYNISETVGSEIEEAYDMELCNTLEISFFYWNGYPEKIVGFTSVEVDKMNFIVSEWLTMVNKGENIAAGKSLLRKELANAHIVKVAEAGLIPPENRKRFLAFINQIAWFMDIPGIRV